MPVKLIIVDDEERVRISLKNIIALHYPEAIIIGEAEDVGSAMEIIREKKPDVVLLDIKISGGTGFDLLKQLMPVNFKVIFITAFDEFALQAFKFSALDYLLKPVIPEELVNALSRAEQQLLSEHLNVKLNVLMHNLSDLTRETKKLMLNSQDKILVVALNEIVMCEAQSNYTCFTLTEKRTVLVTATLGDYDEKLRPHGFFRCHHSRLINTRFVDRVERQEGLIVMKDGSKVVFSSRKYSELLLALQLL